jgi:uncharacterized membrane protein
VKHVTTTFLRGLFTLLPLLLSIYVFIWFVTWVEGFSRSFVFYFVPDSLYLPGIGAAVVFVLIYLFGAVTDRPWTKWGFSLIEGVLLEMPIVKTVYQAIKDFTNFLKPDQGRKSNQVVVVRPHGTNIEMIGLLTRDSLKDLPSPVTKENRVAVYIPMSYQFGGYTIFVPRDWVHPTTMSVEEAMRSVITAWLPGEAKKVEMT